MLPYREFVFRTPLFPVNGLQHKTQAIASPLFHEGVYVASPELYAALEKDVNKEEKVLFSELKYLLRACTRPTPFGLFAGCSVGHIGEETRIELEPASDYRRCTRLDMQYLCALIQFLEMEPALRRQLRYYPNDSLYELGGKLRYIEYHYKGSSRMHEISSVEVSEYLLKSIDAARGGSTIRELARLLVDEDITQEDAEAFIGELIDAQVLKSELDPSVVGGDVLTTLVDKLTRIQYTERLEPISKLAGYLKRIDASEIGTTIQVYREIMDVLRTLGVGYEQKYLFQTDLFKPVRTAVISSRVVDELREALDFLAGIGTSSRSQNIENFKQALQARYEEGEVPLLQVLDNELGIGFPVGQGTSSDLSPLVDDLVTPTRQGAAQVAFGAVDAIMLKKYAEALTVGSDTIRLLDEDFKGIRHPYDLPQTLSAMVTLLGDDAGPSLYLRSAGGSCAANLLGRFCHIDAAIHDLVGKVAESEQKARPDVVFAEISHLPESRIGNIASRPAFREVVLHYLSNTDETAVRSIGLDDLTVACQAGRLILRSKSLGKEVVPRLTCAHNFSLSPIPAYRFLCELQYQDPSASFGLAWSPIFQGQDYLPRVVYGNTILLRQRWLLRQEEVDGFAELSDHDLAERMTALIAARKLAVRVVVPDADNELMLDLADTSCQRLMLSLVKKRKVLQLEEFLFDPATAPVQGVEGSFTNELLILFHKSEQR